MSYTEVTLPEKLFDKAVEQGKKDYLEQPPDSHGFTGNGEEVRIAGMIGETVVAYLVKQLFPNEPVVWPFDVPFVDRLTNPDMILRGRTLEIKLTKTQYSWARQDRNLQRRLADNVMMVFVRDGHKDYTYRVSMIPVREIVEKGRIDYKGRPDRPPLHVIEQYDLEKSFLEVLTW